MSAGDIAAAVARTERLLARRPSAAIQPDAPCVARLSGGLRVVVRHPGGREVATDVVPALGGDGGEVSPGWLVRAGLAACFVTCVALAAAKAGIDLDELEVSAASRSDVRGVLGLADAAGAPVGAGPRDVALSVRIAARGVRPDQLRALVEAARRASPVQAALETATPVAVTVEIGGG